MQFTIIPDWLSEAKELSLNEKIVYAVLLRFQGKNEQSWPSRETVAKRAMLSVRSTERSMAKLLSLNWIEKTRFGRGKTNRYRCLRTSPANLASHPVITRQSGDSEPAQLASLDAVSPARLATLSNGSGEKKTTTPMGGEVFQLLLNLIEKRTYYEVDDVEKSVFLAVDKYASRHGLTSDQVEPVVNGVIDDWGTDASKIKSIGRVLFHRLKQIYDPR